MSNEPELIVSQSSVCHGEVIEKPPTATAIYGLEDKAMYVCPHCKKVVCEDDCGVIGAEPGAVFCANCNGEFYWD